MAAPVIRLDKSKPHSECRGERTPDDPHYKVHFYQSFRNGKALVQLPFDAQGILVADDGRTEAYKGIVEGKEVMHQPLYSDAMRETVNKLKAKLSKPAAAQEEEAEAEADVETEASNTADDVNFESWLRGERRYQPHELRTAARTRYSKNYVGNVEAQLVVDLVEDEKLIPEDQVCERLKKFLPPKAAA